MGSARQTVDTFNSSTHSVLGPGDEQWTSPQNSQMTVEYVTQPEKEHKKLKSFEG